MANNLSDRFMQYSVRVIKLTESLPKSIAGKRIGDQLLRSGTSVGANYEESQAAQSKNDFIHKLQVALKELKESNYWLRLIGNADLLSQEKLEAIIDESNQLTAILSKAVLTAKKRRQQDNH